MSTNLINADSFENYLRSAQPRLIITCENKGRSSSLTPYVSEVDRGWDEVISEGYDPDHSPLGCPVYWRIVKRGDERFYCSTFPVRRNGIISVWGVKGLSYCNPLTGIAVARIETLLERPKCLTAQQH